MYKRKCMKKLNELLRVPISAYKKRMIAIKLFIRGYKKENRAVKQLEKGLLVLDSSGNNVSAGISCYLDYRSGKKGGIVHSIDKSIRLSLEEIARVTGKTPKQLDVATRAAFRKIRKPARKHRIKKVLQMAAVPIASVATFVRKPIKPAVWKWLGIALIVILVLWLGFRLLSSHRSKTMNNQTVSEQSDNSQHQNSWMMVAMTADPKDNDWIENGVAEIATANKTKNPEDAKAAFSAWIEKVKTNHNTLVAAGRALLPDNLANFDEATISPDGSWANDATIQLVSEIRIAVLGQGTITAENAPANGFNSGIEHGKVVRDSVRGITGDRTAIKIVIHGDKKHDDKVRWIMFRCGNVVTIEMFFKNTGHTDEHHHTTTPPSPPKLTPKDPSKDVGANPKVAPWKKDNTGGDSSKGHQVSSGNGATVSNGLQTNTAADATAAKAAATKAAAADAAAQTAAKKDAVVVDSNQSHTSSTPPPANW